MNPTPDKKSVLMISGDANILREGTSAHERFLLQKNAVERLEVVMVVRGQVWSAFRKLLSLRGQHFDVVTVQDPFWRGLLAWHLSWHLKAKLQVQVHTDFLEETKNSPFRHVLGQIVLRHADAVRVVSEKIKQQLQHYTKAPISVLPIFVDLKAVRAALPADRTPFVAFSKLVVVMARLEPEKNVSGALSVMQDVLKAIPDAGLLIAGEGLLKKELQAQARDLGIEKNVVFLGYRADYRSLYKIGDCMLVTSHFESYSAAIVEALAAGCPVVAPDVGIAKEAGAIVVERDKLREAVLHVLKSGTKGELKLPILTKEGWAEAWKNTL